MGRPASLRAAAARREPPCEYAISPVPPSRMGLLTRARTLAAKWEDAAHALQGLPHVIDVRNYGLILGLELAPVAGKPGARAFEVYTKCFERGLLVRQTADILALSPPLIVTPEQIDEMFGTLSAVLRGE